MPGIATPPTGANGELGFVTGVGVWTVGLGTTPPGTTPCGATSSECTGDLLSGRTPFI